MVEQCPYCDKHYAERSSLYRHVKRQHPDYPVPYVGKRYRCRDCDRVFDDCSTLRRHRSIEHTKSLTGSYAGNDDDDDDDDADSSSDGDRPGPSKRGRRDKSAERPYKCPHCEASFIRSSTLSTHIDRRHGESTEAPRFEWESDSSISASSAEEEESDSEAWNGDPETFYRVLNPPLKSWNKKFKVEETELTYTLTKKAVKLAEKGYSLEVMTKVLRHIAEPYAGNDDGSYLQFCLNSFSLDFPINARVSPDVELLVMQILEKIERTLSSKDTFLIDSPLTIHVTHVPAGGDLNVGWTVRYSACADLDEYCNRIRCCWSPPTFSSEDFRCLGMAIACGIKIKEWRSRGLGYFRETWFRQPENDEEFQIFVNDLYDEAGVDYTNPQSLTAFDRFQAVLNERYDLQLEVYSSPDHRDLLYRGNPRRNRQSERINLAVSSTHVYLIHSALSQFLKKKVCSRCSFVYGRRAEHTCRPACPSCKTTQCYRYIRGGGVEEPVWCSVCDRVWRNDICYSRHREIVCRDTGCCQECYAVVPRLAPYIKLYAEHDCRQRQNGKCRHCKKLFLKRDGHLCTVSRPNWQEVKTPERFYIVAFDYETYEEEEDGKRFLVPYLVCAAIFCHQCFFHIPWMEDCTFCGKKRRCWYEQNDEFCRWLFFDPSRDQAVPVVALAHNARRFDSLFPLEYLLRNRKTPLLKLSGQKCITLKAHKTTIKDFASFAPMKLSEVPGAFGFTGSKGYFPWRLARKENLHSVWPGHPPKKYYAPDLLKSTGELRDFSEWHGRVAGLPFDFEKESKKYCKTDVEILGRGIQEYVKMALTVGSVNPITSPQCITLASFACCMYRQNFMPSEQCIGIIPRCGYDGGGKAQSVLALKTLDWLNQKRYGDGLPLIRHKERGGEKEILKGDGGSYFLDGFVPETGEAFEVNGCLHHACDVCYGTPLNPYDRTADRIHPLTGTTFKQVAQKSKFKEWFVRKSPEVASLTVIRECEIAKELRTNPLLKAFWESREELQPYYMGVEIRDSLYGGVCEVFRLSASITPEEAAAGCGIQLYDVVSMYPAVQFFNDFFPSNHPRIYDHRTLPGGGRDWTLATLRQFSPCTCSVWILPPEEELYPCLPARIRGKTMYTLCHACAEENRQDSHCPHRDPRRRGLIGTYTSVDLEMALGWGYRLIQVFQCWSWRAPHPDTAPAPIFKNYVMALIRLKVTNSGWPADVESEEQKSEYLEEWRSVTGIRLLPEEIRFNPAARTLAKLLLNSLWGKLCERAHTRHLEFVKDYRRFRDLLFGKQREVKELFLTSEETAAVTYDVPEFDCPESSFHNVCMGAFVTAFARKAMFEILYTVIGRGLYCDTDSVAVVTRPGLSDPRPLGRVLGQLKSELPPDTYIRRWQCLGPKSYRYEYGPFRDDESGRETWRTVLKCKGISKTPAVTRALDGDAYEALIEFRLDELKHFYDELIELSPEGGGYAAARARRMFEEHRRMDWRTGESTKGAGLFLPNPGLARDAKRGKIWARDGCKVVRYTADKRVFAPSAVCLGMPSLPFGWRLGQPGSLDLRYDEESFRFVINDDE